MEGLEKDILREICQGNQKGDQEEPVAKAARKLWQASGKMVYSMEWSEDKGVLWFRGKIYVPRNADLQRQVVFLCHDTKIAKHPRHWKTLELVSRDYWWPQMSRYIGQYVSTCDLCLRTEPIRQALVGELYLLQILNLQWDMLSVDFIMELPLSFRHDAVMTMVDSVSKQAHFIPMHTTVTAEGATRLFLHQVWKLQSSDMHSLGPWTPVCSLFHQRTLLPTRNKVGVFHSLASSNRQTDRACQPGVRPVPLALCKQVPRRLVRPLTPGRVPA